MKRFLLLCALPALALAQATLPTKKVVVSGLGRLSENEIRELKQAALAAIEANGAGHIVGHRVSAASPRRHCRKSRSL